MRTGSKNEMSQKTELTVRACKEALTSDGCTGLSGTRERPGQPKNHVMRVDQQLGVVGNQLFVPRNQRCPVVAEYWFVSSHSTVLVGETQR